MIVGWEATSRLQKSFLSCDRSRD